MMRERKRESLRSADIAKVRETKTVLDRPMLGHST